MPELWRCLQNPSAVQKLLSTLGVRLPRALSTSRRDHMRPFVLDQAGLCAYSSSIFVTVSGSSRAYQ